MSHVRTSWQPTSYTADAKATALRLRAAFLVSSIGDWIYRFCIPTMVLVLTGSAVSTAIAYALELIPYIVIGAAAGVAADRYDRRRILITCDLVSAAIAVMLTITTLTAHPSLLLLYAMAFLLACVRPFYFPAFQGLIVQAVPSVHLSRMNAWTQTADSALGFLGPVVGTSVIAAVGIPTASGLNALSFAVSGLLIWQIAARKTLPGKDQPGPKSTASFTRDLADGFRVLWSLPAVRWGTFLMAAANLAAYVIEANLIYVVVQVQQLSTLVLGLVFAAQGLGALLGALTAPFLIDRLPTGTLLAAGMALSALAMGIPAAVPHVGAIVVGWALEGVATSLIVVAWFTVRQQIVPPQAIGRVVAVGRTIAYATIPVGAILGGLLASQAHPTRGLFLLAFALQSVVAVLTVFSPVRTISSTRPGPPEPAASSTNRAPLPTPAQGSRARHACHDRRAPPAPTSPTRR